MGLDNVSKAAASRAEMEAIKASDLVIQKINA
jgi:hypothetical protein